MADLDPVDELNELLRDARGHATWLAEGRDRTVLKEAQAPVARPAVRPAPAAQAAPPVARPQAAPPARPAPAAPVASRPAPAPIAPARPPTAAPPAAKPAQPALLDARPQLKPGSTDPVVRLEEIRTELGPCTRCKLCKGRTNIVFGVGNPKAELVFVGEGPGEQEDLRAEPFVGPAGQLLTKMIEAMGLQREQVYICNVVKCRPPGNRNPEPDEIAACEPFLLAQLDAIKPKVIVTLGKFAAHTLLQETTAITRLRGQWRTFRGVKLMPTFHPSYLLRSPQEKRKAWEDLQLVMKELGLKRA